MGRADPPILLTSMVQIADLPPPEDYLPPVTGQAPAGQDSLPGVRERIRVRGLVQGVGFRPSVWRLARELGLRGDVRNDGEGVLIQVQGEPVLLEAFCRRLWDQCPPLARIDAVEREPLTGPLSSSDGFRILASDGGRIETGVVADAATCAAEIADPADRRYRYPFANCTHCGPRLSIVRAIPYDRANTSMADFALCPDCRREYQDPEDRRFHAQPIACPRCGPRAWLEDREGIRLEPEALGAEDAVAAASLLLAQGKILAIKGIGGFHLACDATNAGAVAGLRRRKGRYRKPFALMAFDLDVIQRFARLVEAEAQLLQSPAAPVVLLEAGPAGAAGVWLEPPPKAANSAGIGWPAGGPAPTAFSRGDPQGFSPEAGPEGDRSGLTGVAEEVAPGQASLGFMLPYSPLHLLLLRDWDRPLVMTSGNRSEEPQCIDNGEARQRLGAVADILLLHDRPILNRVDDSVMRFMDGVARPLRRARGLAPAPVPLPPGFEQAPPVLAMGGELKNTLCLLRPGQAILSQHLGDLEDARTAE